MGIQFDVANVLSVGQLLFTAKLLGFAVLVKVLPCLLFVFSGLSILKSVNIGLLMTSRLSLIIVAATIGLEFGFITEAFRDAIILLAVLTCLLGPSLFKAFYTSEAALSDSGGIEKRKLSVGWMRQWK